MATALKRKVEPTRITSDPEILGGMACIGGTRVPAETIADYLASGYSDEDIFADYPNLPLDALEAVRRWVKESGPAARS